MTYIGILSNTMETREYKALVKAFKARGAEARFLNPIHMAAKVGKQPALLYKNKALEKPAVVLVRSTGGVGAHPHAIIRQMVDMGIEVVNSLEAIEKARDKVHTMQLAAAAGLPIPETLVHSPTEAVVQAWGKRAYRYPVIIKKTTGSRGNGVMLIREWSQLSGVTGFIPANDNSTGFMVQEYIDDLPGSDVRVLVVGGKVLGAIMRTGQVGEPRANASRGGSVKRYALPAMGIELSEATAKLLGLDICGIDLLFLDDGFVLCEANAQPGFSGFQEACPDIDVAGALADYILSRIPRATKDCA